MYASRLPGTGGRCWLLLNVGAVATDMQTVAGLCTGIRLITLLGQSSRRATERFAAPRRVH